MPEQAEDLNNFDETEGPSDAESTEAKQDVGKLGALFSPEGIIMIFIAGFLDLIGLLILLFGLDDIGILDIIGLIIIGGWMFSRSGQIIGTRGAKKVGGKVFKRLGLSFVGEIIPYFGNIAPCWILAVYFELKNK